MFKNLFKKKKKIIFLAINDRSKINCLGEILKYIPELKDSNIKIVACDFIDEHLIIDLEK